MAIEFRSETVTSRFTTPAGEVHDVEVEFRRDPLTGRTARVAHFGLFNVQPMDFGDLAAASRDLCPFCPERVATMTVMWPEDLVPTGRLTLGESTLFPNLSPYDQYGAVVALTHDHDVAMSALTPAQLADGLRVSAQFAGLVRAHSSPPPAHTIVGMNFLPPAGSSLVHPHYHALVSDHPGDRHEQELAASRAWRAEHGRVYLADLLDAEAGGERCVAEGAATTWLTSFVSRGVIPDALGVVRGVSHLSDLDEAALDELAAGISHVLGYFGGIGMHGFNLSVTGDAAGHHDRWLTVRISPRAYVTAYAPVSDVGFLVHLFDDPVMVQTPEALASALREAVRL